MFNRSSYDSYVSTSQPPSMWKLILMSESNNKTDGSKQMEFYSCDSKDVKHGIDTLLVQERIGFDKKIIFTIRYQTKDLDTYELLESECKKRDLTSEVSLVYVDKTRIYPITLETSCRALVTEYLMLIDKLFNLGLESIIKIESTLTKMNITDTQDQKLFNNRPKKMKAIRFNKIVDGLVKLDMIPENLSRFIQIDDDLNTCGKTTLGYGSNGSVATETLSKKFNEHGVKTDMKASYLDVQLNLVDLEKWIENKLSTKPKLTI